MAENRRCPIRKFWRRTARLCCSARLRGRNQDVPAAGPTSETPHAKRPPLLLTCGAPGATRPRMGGACLLETPHAKRTMRPTFDTALDGVGGVNRLSSNRFAWGISNKVAGESMKLQHGGKPAAPYLARFAWGLSTEVRPIDAGRLAGNSAMT